MHSENRRISFHLCCLPRPESTARSAHYASLSTEILAGMPQKVLDSLAAHTPLGRMGAPEEVAEAYVWLASDAASFVNGAVLSVDGGVVTGT